MGREAGNLLRQWWSAAMTLAALVLVSQAGFSHAAVNQAAELVGIEPSGSGVLQPADQAKLAAKVEVIREKHVSDPPLQGQLLFDNGPLVNSPGTGASGADESMLQNTSLGMSSLGYAHSPASGYRVADDFTVTDGKWNLTYIRFYAYQTGWVLDEFSPITGVYLQIWDGPPNDPASKVIWGDLTTNRLNSLYSSWDDMYRVAETTSGASNRAILSNVAKVETSLPRGVYWLDWVTDGSVAFSGPWVPPITVTGQTTTGNAMQYSSGTGQWTDLVDIGQQGLPFKVYGSPFSWIMMNPPTIGAGAR